MRVLRVLDKDAFRRRSVGFVRAEPNMRSTCRCQRSVPETWLSALPSGARRQPLMKKKKKLWEHIHERLVSSDLLAWCHCFPPHAEQGEGMHSRSVAEPAGVPMASGASKDYALLLSTM
jgi:hypothetical protein